MCWDLKFFDGPTRKNTKLIAQKIIIYKWDKWTVDGKRGKQTQKQIFVRVGGYFYHYSLTFLDQSRSNRLMLAK